MRHHCSILASVADGEDAVIFLWREEIEVYDYVAAVAKMRGLELIAEAAAERRATMLRRARRKRDRKG